MKPDTLIALATKFLSQELGSGTWRTSPRLWTPPSNAMPGLNLGQTLYTYEDYELREKRVVAIRNGVGFYIETSLYEGFLVCPFLNDEWATTIEGALVFADSREELARRIDYYEKGIRAIEKLEAARTNAQKK